MIQAFLKQILNFDFIISLIVLAIIGEFIPENPLLLIVFFYWCYGISLYYFDTKQLNTYSPIKIISVLFLGFVFPYIFHTKNKK
jgi:hypothetical protein